MQSVSLDCHQHIIDIQDLSFSYGEQKVISNLNYSVRERDFLGIIGSNGAGKTTLMKMIVGLLPASSGEIKLFGT
ncbi:ATP-binding cassette domain-containing protein, partial [Paenibacillus odorifer]